MKTLTLTAFALLALTTTASAQASEKLSATPFFQSCYGVVETSYGSSNPSDVWRDAWCWEFLLWTSTGEERELTTLDMVGFENTADGVGTRTKPVKTTQAKPVKADYSHCTEAGLVYSCQPTYPGESSAQTVKRVVVETTETVVGTILFAPVRAFLSLIN